MTDVDSRTAALTAAVLDAESIRHEKPPDDAPTVVLPGVGDDAVPFREVLRSGGVRLLVVLTLLNLVDEFDRAALVVLAPDIQRSLGLSDAGLGAIAGIGGLVVTLGAVPLGYLADRMRRTTLTAACTALWSVFAMAGGFVQAGWQLAGTRIVNGLGKANSGPVHNSLIADAYPVAGRARAFAVHAFANPVGVALGPLLAGGIAVLAGGDEGWRWAFALVAVPGFALAFVAARLKEPARGRFERIAVEGAETAALYEPERTSIALAFARLKRIRTFYFILVGVGALGFALFSLPVFVSLFLEEHYGLDAFDRGMVTSVIQLGGLVGVPLGGIYGDRIYRRNPAGSLLLMGTSVAAFGLLYPLALYMPNLGLLIAVAIVAAAFPSMAFVPLNAIVAAITPYRLRAMGYAMLGVYIFLFGSFLGGILTGALSDAFGPRTALTLIVPPSALLGGALITFGARHVTKDMAAVVADLLEEHDARARVVQGHAPPALQVRGLDFSYGPVQVLFDVDLDVAEGEVLALLGTNGAGKSTLLRCIAGLAAPDRGVIRLSGRPMTYTEAEYRTREGVVLVPGGKAVFTDLTVEDNLRAGAHTFIWDARRVRTKVDEVLELFPILGERFDQPAGTLSGGEQQMLAIAKGMLLEPRLLLLDELSLGLAPVVVQQILAVVEQAKARGLTMVIVEQSVNVALAMADRAVFMEKGEIRFSGAARDLLERDDLVRAVFLGGEGG